MDRGRGTLAQEKKDGMKGALLLAATVLITTLIGSRGLISAIRKNALLNAHDMSGYAIYLTEFHSNIKTGSLLPVWAESLQYGYGEPHLQFRPPLQLFVTELLYLVSGNSFAALNLTMMLFVAIAALGMYLLIARVCEALGLRERPWACALGAAGYVLSPYFLQNIYVRGALSELSAQAVLPFFALAFFRLTQAPNARRLAVASLAYAALATSHASIQLIATPLLFAALFYYRPRGPALALPIAATALGLAASSFYWAAALIEKSYLKLPLIRVGFDSFPGHFARLDQLLSFDVRMSAGLLAFVGTAIALFRLAAEIPLRKLTLAQYRACVGLLLLVGISAYFTHRVSAAFYEWLPWLQVMSFPWRWLAVLIFAAAPLAAVALSLETKNRWVWGIAMVAVLALGYAQARPRSYLALKPADFSSYSIAANGWGWPTNASSPSTAAVTPKARSSELLEFKQGRGETRCARKSPTAIECEVVAIRPSTLKLNVLDYPRWEAKLNAKAVPTDRDRVWGTPLVSVPPGKHVLQWKLRHTTTRVVTRVFSAFALLVLLALLFKDQIRKTKTRSPQRA